MIPTQQEDQKTLWSTAKNIWTQIPSCWIRSPHMYNSTCVWPVYIIQLYIHFHLQDICWQASIDESIHKCQANEDWAKATYYYLCNLESIHKAILLLDGSGWCCPFNSLRWLCYKLWWGARAKRYLLTVELKIPIHTMYTEFTTYLLCWRIGQSVIFWTTEISVCKFSRTVYYVF